MPQALSHNSEARDPALEAAREPRSSGAPIVRKLGPETLLPTIVQALHAAPIPMPDLLVKVRDAALQLIFKQSLIVPRVAYAVHGVASIEDKALILNDTSRLPTPEHLTGAEFAAASVCGIGRGIDQQVAVAFDAGNGRLALALDLIGTHALFRLSNYIREFVYEDARKNGLAIGGPLEPGMQNFPLGDAAVLVRLADAEPMGFFVTSSGAVGPGRVLTFAIPIGRAMPPWQPTDRCRTCPSLEACRRMGMAVDD